MGWLNVVGNVAMVLAMQVAFGLVAGSAVVFGNFALGAAPIFPLAELRWSLLLALIFSITVVPAAFILLTWVRKRLVMEARPELGRGLSKYAKVAMIVFGFLLVEPLIGLALSWEDIAVWMEGDIYG